MAFSTRSRMLPIASFFLAALAHAGPPRFEMQVLPSTDGCEAYSQWNGLARGGRAVAILTCEDGAASKAVTWSGAALAELSTLGGSSAAPYGIGHDGIVVGTAESAEAYDEASKVQRPVAWEAGVVRDLGTLGGPLGAATAMNAAGLIVGASQREQIDPSLGRRPMRACVWEGRQVRDLGDLGGPESVAYDLNERGWIVGSSTTSGVGFERHAFVHDGRTMHDLGTLGGPISAAWAINARGEVVGYSYPTRHASAGRPSWRAFVWREGTLTDLGTLGGPFSEALDIDDHGDIVGWSRLASGVDHAVLWSSGEMLDLNDLTRARRDCVLTRATAITNEGAILADVRCGGRPSVALLTPAAGAEVAGRAR